MHVKDEVGAQVLNHPTRFHSLVEQVTGIQVGPHRGTGDLAQPQQPGSVEDRLPGVHLDGDPDSAVGRMPTGLLPEGRQHFVPLPLEKVQEFLLEAVGHPVGIGSPARISRAAAHGDHRIHSQLVSQINALEEVVAMLLAPLRIGIHRISIAVQGADHQVAAVDGSLEFRSRPGIGQQQVGVAVGSLGKPPGGDLNGFDPLLHHPIQGGGEGQIGKSVGKQSYFHGWLPGWSVGCVLRNSFWAVTSCLPGRPPAARPRIQRGKTL